VGSVLRDKEESGAEANGASAGAGADASGGEAVEVEKTNTPGDTPIGRVGPAGAKEDPGGDGPETVESVDSVKQDKSDAEGGDTGAPPQEEEGHGSVGNAGNAGPVGASAFGRIGLAGGKETHFGGPEKIQAVGSVLREKLHGGSGGEVDETGDTSGGHEGQKGGLGLQSGREVSDGAGQVQEDDALGEIPDME
jgi:hypothetical protein